MANKKFSKFEIRKSRNSLRTMTKNSNRHRLRAIRRIIKYGMLSFFRNIWLSVAATLVMTITLIILFVTVIASVILTNTADAMRSKIDITIFFKPETSERVLSDMTNIIKENPNIKSIQTATAKTEYQRFLKENSDDPNLLQAIKTDSELETIMLESMQATMRIKVYDPEKINEIKTLVKTNSTFSKAIDNTKPATYDVNSTEISTVTSWANIAKNGGLVIGAVFLVISILVIFNTVRMAIFSRREEIYMMKLVGADNSFIRGPFLVEAQMCGVISGIFASAIGFHGFRLLAPKFDAYGIDISSISKALFSYRLIFVFLIAITIGMLIGTISARLALRKHLR